MHHRLTQTVLIALALLTAPLIGCAGKSPEERIADTRKQYSVQLQSFRADKREPVQEAPMEEGAEEAVVTTTAEAAAAVGESAAEGAEEAMEEGGEMMEPEESGPSPHDVTLFLIVRFAGTEPLPGITVEVTKQDPFGKESEPTLHWIDTAGMAKSEVRQVDLVLEDVEFETGDAYSVYFSEVVPAEQRSQYREFAEAGSP